MQILYIETLFFGYLNLG